MTYIFIYGIVGFMLGIIAEYHNVFEKQDRFDIIGKQEKQTLFVLFWPIIVFIVLWLCLLDGINKLAKLLKEHL